LNPVVTRLVVFGAAVGSLALLAGAVMAQSKAPTPVPATAASPPPASPAPVAPISTPPRPAAQTPPPPAPALEAPARAQEPPRPQEADGTDGSAAVDWLLKGRR
jgi:hypothetical protein